VHSGLNLNIHHLDQKRECELAVDTGQASQKNIRFVTLDGLRGVAALFIVIWHRRWWTIADMHYGYIAIDFFWLLSGFVIAHAYGHKLADGSMTIRGFIRVRIQRLWPLIIFGAALGCFVEFCHAAQQHWFGGAVKAIAAFPLSALLIPVPWAVGPFPLNGPMWSLFFEVLGNLVFMVIAMRLTIARLAAMIMVLVAFILGLLVTTMSIDYGVNWAGLIFGFPRMLMSFMIGVGVYWLWERDRLPRIGLPFWMLSLILVLLMAAVPRFTGWTDVAFVSFCVLVAFPLIIVSGAQSQPQGLWHKVATISAELSYPLYIAHYPLLNTFDYLRGGGFTPAHPYLTLSVQVALICWASWLVSKYYDKPVRKWLSTRRHAKAALNEAVFKA
jgi:peptidoglycan/LPS O-acetylase OafA/YrhL